MVRVLAEFDMDCLRVHDDLRDLAAEWVRANGVDPNEVSLGGLVDVVLTDGGPAIRYLAFRLGDDGKPLVDSVAKVFITEQLIVPMVTGYPPVPVLRRRPVEAVTGGAA